MADSKSNLLSINSQDSEEIWKVIPDYTDYEISSKGRVRRVATVKWYPGKFKATCVNKSGYVMVSLRRGKENHPHCLHRLIMRAFAFPVEGREIQVNHIDGNKLNNSLENLEYVSARENTLHAIRTGLRHPFPQTPNRARGDRHWTRANPERLPRGEAHPQAKLTPDIVRQIRAAHAALRSYRLVAIKFGIGATTVGRIVKREAWGMVD
jgi:hypothetical protein